jgi:AraC-like DNA-binding protein
LGTYRGVYINGEKLNKISYTDGQIREFGDLTMVCYNGLLKYKDNEEVVIYDNDNSILADAKYGHIRDIFSIGNSKYLLISTKGIYAYDEQSSVFELLYACEKKIVAIKNKIDDRIKDRGKFDFIDNGRYLSLDVHANGFDVVANAIDDRIVDALECEKDGRFFYAVTEDARFLKYIRSSDGLDLVNQIGLDSPAHTIMDYEDIIFIAGNSGLSVYHGIKNQIARDIIIDEFNSSAVYKSSSEISFGGIHGVYTFKNLNQLDKELVFKDYEIDNNGSLLLGGVVSSLLLCIGFITFRFRKKTIVSDEQMIARIKRFIRSNLSIVTLKMLEVELNLDYNELNSLSKSFRPAKYIKERRGAIAKEMLLANESISEISKKTGYSETYLVKNKYRFIK